MHDSPIPLGYRRALINNKGGVGKTAFALELAAALARRGRRVLVVDLDPQANATRRAATLDVFGHVTLAEVLRDPGTGEAARCVRRCGWQTTYASRIHVLPSSLSLEDRVLEAAMPGAVKRLSRALYGVSDDYDWTFIDCPPSMGPLTQMAIAALNADDDAILLPTEPAHDSISGAMRVVRLVDKWSDDLVGHEVRVDAVLVNGVRASTALHQVRLEDLPGEFVRRVDHETGDPVMIPIWWPHIPLAAALEEAQDQAVPADTDRRLVQAGIVGRFDHLALHLDHWVTDGQDAPVPAMSTAIPTGGHQ